MSNSLTSAELKILAAGVAGTFMVAIDGTIMNIALPNIMAQFNETPDRAQLVVSAYTLASAVSTPATPFLIERLGLKRSFILGLIGFLLGSILCGLAWNSNILIFFRVIQGLAGGLLLPCAMTMMVIFIPAERRATAMAVFGIPVMIGPALGPIIGGYLVTYWSWRFCFYVNVPVVFVALLLANFWLTETQISLKNFDYLGFIFAAIGLASILFAFSYAPTWHWDDWRIITLLIAGCIAIVIFVIIELRRSQPLLDLRLFKTGTFSRASILFAVVFVAFYCILFLLPLFLENLRGLNAMQAGLLMLSMSLGNMVAIPVSGILYNKIGVSPLVVAGLAFMGITGLWLQNMDITTSNEIFQWMMFWRGVGTGLCMMPLMNCALSSVPEEKSPQASSIVNTLQLVAISMGVAIFASLLDSFQKTDYAIMAQTATMDSPIMLGLLSRIQVAVMQAGQAAEVANQAGIEMLYQYFTLRTTITAFEKDFVIIGIISLISILPAFMLPRGRMEKREGGALVA